jgi:hypothetical protein
MQTSVVSSSPPFGNGIPLKKNGLITLELPFSSSDPFSPKDPPFFASYLEGLIPLGSIPHCGTHKTIKSFCQDINVIQERRNPLPLTTLWYDEK